MVFAAGCRSKKQPAPPPVAADYSHELPAGQVALRKITPDLYPDFTVNASDLPNVRAAIENSLKYMEAPSSRGYYPYLDITHERAVASLKALLALIDSTPQTGATINLNSAIARQFDVYRSIGGYNSGTGKYTGDVLFTGYFTPIYDASLTRTGEYPWPLYKRPADLLTDSEGLTASRKLSDDSVQPGYYTRAQIETSQLLAGQELVWLRSRWDAYVITIQGSARLRLNDQGGRIFEIGYAGNNGHEYTSPGKQMLADGVITRDQLTLRGLRDYFSANPAAMDKYLHLNERYVFFTERPGGPFGSLNVPVTPFSSIATDKSVYPRAMPAFVIAPIPSTTGGIIPYRGFMLDQDTGGAIRAAGRADIYMGVGPQAEFLAGQQLHAGALYYIAVKE
jgi:membrane-bound lytic murein transglycosylase A